MGKQTKHNKNKETSKSYLDASTSSPPIHATGESISNSSLAPTPAPRVTMEPSVVNDPASNQSSDRIEMLADNIDQLNTQISHLVSSVSTLKSDMSAMKSGKGPRPRSVPSNISMDRRAYHKDDDNDDGDDDSDG